MRLEDLRKIDEGREREWSSPVLSSLYSSDTSLIAGDLVPG